MVIWGRLGELGLSGRWLSNSSRPGIKSNSIGVARFYAAAMLSLGGDSADTNVTDRIRTQTRSDYL